MTAESLEAGYWRAYQDFYRWRSIFRGAWAKEGWTERLRHLAYAGGWKKFEPLWDWVIRARRVSNMLPLLEGVLAGFGSPLALNRTSRMADGVQELDRPNVKHIA
jgi:hypothetical protein